MSDTSERNSYGLFDNPVRSEELEHVRQTLGDLERQVDAGAFVVSREEAQASGLLSPYDEQDVVITDANEG